jgi:ketosteroid isomerase-like protein
MTIVRAQAFALMALPLIAACGSADPGEVLETVRATETAQLEAMAAKDLRGATRNYDTAAVLLTPGGTPASGVTAIERRYADLLKDPNFAIAMKPGEGWAAESGELATTTATGTVRTGDAASG